MRWRTADAAQRTGSRSAAISQSHWRAAWSTTRSVSSARRKPPAQLVSERVHLRDERRERRADARRLDGNDALGPSRPEVEAVRLVDDARERNAGDSRQPDPLDRDERARVQTRIAAWGRLAPRGDPLDEPHEERAERGQEVEGIAAEGGRAGKTRAGRRREWTHEVLGRREVVDPLAGQRLDVAARVHRGVDERGCPPPVFVAGSGVEDAGPVRGVERPRREPVLPARLGIELRPAR